MTLRSPRGGAVLEKDQGVWLVVSEDSLPAEANVVGEMLATIGAFSKRDKISSNPEKQALYQVDSSGTAVTVADGNARVVASFVVGKSGPDYQSTYVRDAGSNDVIMAQGSFAHIFDRRNRTWQDRRIFAVEPAEVVEVGITRAGETTIVKRGEDGVWSTSLPESTTCDQTKMSVLVRTLATLRCEDFAGRKPLAEWGIAAADSSVYFRTAAGDLHTLLVGRAAAGESFYAATDQGGPVYIVPKRNIKTLLPAPADLLAKPEGEPPEGRP
jgi:hypothetical protein